MTPIILSTLGYILSWLKERRNYMKYVLSCTLVYLIALSFVRTLDYLLPIYFLALLLPVLFSIRKVSGFTFLVAVYEIGYLLYGMIFQDTVASITAFVSRDWQFLAFFLVFDALQNKSKTYFDNWSITSGSITIAVLVESILGVYLALYNYSMGRSLRLVADAQPITGNISIVFLPVLAYLFYNGQRDEVDRQERSHTKYLKFVIALFVWTLLSGTRGYILVYGLTFISLIYSYFFDVRDYDTPKRNNRTILFLCIVVLIIGTAILAPTLVERAMMFLRVGPDASTGIRKYENAAVIGFWKDAPLGIKLVGIGIGGKPGNYPDFLTNLQSQFALGMWDRAHYLNDSGAIFHNLYACILCSQGIIGIIIVLLCYLAIWKRITICTTNSKGLRATLHLYEIGFAVMNYYRWSATCGIGELIILACVLMLNAKKEVYKCQ